MRAIAPSSASRPPSPRGEALHGFEVDDAARTYIKDRGFGEYFVHRTGHSIGEEVHGTGANMDNLETHDERRIIAGTCFSIEPGVYLPEFGIRSEVNVYVGAKRGASYRRSPAKTCYYSVTIIGSHVRRSAVAGPRAAKPRLINIFRGLSNYRANRLDRKFRLDRTPAARIR